MNRLRFRSIGPRGLPLLARVAAAGLVTVIATACTETDSSITADETSPNAVRSATEDPTQPVNAVTPEFENGEPEAGMPNTGTADEGMADSIDAAEDDVRGATLGPVVENDAASIAGVSSAKEGDPEDLASATPVPAGGKDALLRKNDTGAAYDPEVAKKDEAAIARAAAALKIDDGTLKLTFEKISNFEYVEPKGGKPETLKKGQVPAEILAYDGRKATMIGYMVPLDLTAEGKVKLFFLASNTQACCLGKYPSIHEVVEVRVEEGCPYHKDVPVQVTGTFEVGEDFDEYGYLLSLYRLKAGSVKSAWDR